MALRKLVVTGKEYAEDPETNIIYDFELYKMGNLVERGGIGLPLTTINEVWREVGRG